MLIKLSNQNFLFLFSKTNINNKRDLYVILYIKKCYI